MLAVNDLYFIILIRDYCASVLVFQISAAPVISASENNSGQQGAIHIAVNPTNMLRNNEWVSNPSNPVFDACVVCNDKASGNFILKFNINITVNCKSKTLS